MEVLAPLALTAIGTAAAGAMRYVTTGGTEYDTNGGVRMLSRDDPLPAARGMQFDNATSGQPFANPTAPGSSFDPIETHFRANAQVGRADNLQVLRTVDKDPKYALTPESGVDFQYDQMNRGNSELENQWYHSNLTKDSETPLSMGYLPEYKKSSGIQLRDPDTPAMLKPQKRELLEADVWVAQPESDRRFYDPLTGEQSRRARAESKYASGTGALDGYMMNDKPGNLGGAWKGWSTGLEPTRQFTGYHPRQRFFRKHDNLRQRNPHGLRALNKETQHFEIRGNLEGQYTNEKKTQVANYHQIAVADGGRQQPHLPDGMRRVELRNVQRDKNPVPKQGFSGRQPAGFQSQMGIITK